MLKHPTHLVFNFLAYTVGIRIYLSNARERLPAPVRSTVVLGALAGALVGSVLLACLYDPMVWSRGNGDPMALFWQGQTVVGGLLGGLAGVELAKKSIGYSRSTGDSFVVPLAVGMMIGRVGCFLTGLGDNTHGIATALPWGYDFGDGVRRHPTQLYDIVFLGGFLLCLKAKLFPREREGDLFKIFMIAYLAYRFAVDFLKPYPRPFLGLHIIQVACAGGLAYYAADLRRFLSRSAKAAT